jgi:hydrogenase expression/formation protein HypE
LRILAVPDDNAILPVGKLPPALLAEIIGNAPVADPRVFLGAGVGLDCAVVAVGGRLLIFKSDPVTFATDEIGWYLVQVNANDLATTGAVPRWLMLTMLLPEGGTTPALVRQWTGQVYDACRELHIDVIGGHTEITHGLQRPILSGTLVGEMLLERGEELPGKLVTPRGMLPGDRLILTKGVPIEATALLAREFPDRLSGVLSDAQLREAQGYLRNPGISVVRDAALAIAAGGVTAMHDPTEGGLISALWELAEASGQSLWFHPEHVPVPALATKVCAAFKLDPLAAIASGALLLAASPASVPAIRQALAKAGIPCAEIGMVKAGKPIVWRITAKGRRRQPRPQRDEIARIFG